MRKPRPTGNPSGLLQIKEWYERGLITHDELLRLRREALEVNVYTGKERSDEKHNGENNNNPTFG